MTERLDKIDYLNSANGPRSRKFGATVFLAMALFGGASAKSAEAHPSASPNGDPIITDPNKVQQESIKAYMQIKKRWNGIVLFHASKKDWIPGGFAPSPHALRLDLSYIEGEDGYTALKEPAVVKFENQTYLEYENGFIHEWLNVRKANAAGALTFLAFKDSAPRPISFNPRRVTSVNQMPSAVSYDHMVPLNKNSLFGTDINGKVHELKISNVVPHP